MEKKKMKLWKKILIIILIIIILFLIHITRNLIIINNISNKLSKLENSNNYKLTSYSYNGNNFSIINYYFKDGKSLEKMILISLDGNDKREIIKVFDGENLETFITEDEEKIYYVDSEEYTEHVRFYNGLDTGSFFNNIIMATMTKISTEECNGKKCYVSSTIFPKDHFKQYYDKKTGVIVRDETSSFENNIEINCFKDSFYEFDVVTDNDLKKPDISEYQTSNENK